MSRLYDEFCKILVIIGESWMHTSEIANKSLAGRRLPSLLTNLQNLGFVERVVIDELSPLSESKWRVTKEGKAFIRLSERTKGEGKESAYLVEKQKTVEYPKIIMTLPSIMSKTFLLDHPEIGLTGEIIRDMFNSCEKGIAIFCPYIDTSFSFLVQEVKRHIPIHIVTTPYIGLNSKEHPNASLERLSQSHNLLVRYLREASDGVQLYQIHAKLVIIDSKCAYIGSSNLKETSLFHNLELGTIIEDNDLVAELSGIFEDIYHNYAVGREAFQC